MRPGAAGLQALLAVPVLALWATAAVAQTAGATLLKESTRVFSRPHDVVLSADGTRLLVADLGNHRVQVLDADTLEVLGSLGDGELSSPHDVTIDGEGRLLVADTGNDRVAIYRLEGNSGRRVAELTEGLAKPEGVGVDGTGRIYVTNVGLANVVVFGPDGAPERSAGGPGSGPGQYVRPHDIDVDGAGNVLVADPGNDRIQILDASLAHRRSLGGGAPYDFSEPKYFDVDALGWLFVADQYNDAIKIYDPGYRLVARFPPAGSRDLRLNKPEGVEVKGDRMWIADTYNNRILLLRLEGMAR